MKYILLCVLLVACGQKEKPISFDYAKEMRELNKQILDSEIDYLRHVDRDIGFEEKSRGQGEFYEGMSVNAKTVVCQDNFIKNGSVCFAQTNAGTTIKYYCSPIYDSYKCHLG